MEKRGSDKLAVDDTRISDMENQIKELVELVKKSSHDKVDDSHDVDVEFEDFSHDNIDEDANIMGFDEILKAAGKQKENFSNDDLYFFEEQIETRDNLINFLKRKLRVASKIQEKNAKYQKQISVFRSELTQSKQQITELKNLLKKKDETVGEFPKRIEERDKLIKQLNEQILVLKQEKRVLDEANSRLISELDYMQADLKRLDSQIETKDKQVQDVRQLLQSEKDLAEQRLRKRLRDFAEKETKKEVLLTVKISELMDIINKQREVIENINVADMSLYEQFDSTIKQIRDKRNSIDYSIVDKKIEEIKFDVASVSDLINMPEKRIAENIEKSEKDDFEMEEQQEDNFDPELVTSIRQALESGDPPEIVKSSSVDAGNDEDTVQKIIDIQMKQLNMQA